MTNSSGNAKVQSEITPTSMLLKAHDTALADIKTLLNDSLKKTIDTTLQKKTDALMQHIDNLNKITENIENKYTAFEQGIETRVSKQISCLGEATTAIVKLEKQLDDLTGENSQLQSLMRKIQKIDDIHKFSSETSKQLNKLLEIIEKTKTAVDSYKIHEKTLKNVQIEVASKNTKIDKLISKVETIDDIHKVSSETSEQLRNLLEITKNTKGKVDSIAKHEDILKNIQIEVESGNGLLEKIQQDLYENIEKVELLRKEIKNNVIVLTANQNDIIETKNKFSALLKKLDETIATDKPEPDNSARQSQKTLIILVVISTVASLASILLNIIP